MIKNIFKIVTISTAIFALTGCGGGDGIDLEELEKIGLSFFEDNSYSIVTPAEWEIIGPEDFGLGIPPSTIAAFRNNIKSEIFTANLNITRIKLDNKISSKDFAKATINQNKNQLIDFQEISRTDHKIPGTEDETYIIAFQGRGQATDPIVNFKQVYITNKDEAYTATAAFQQNEDESIVILINQMLESFSLN